MLTKRYRSIFHPTRLPSLYKHPSLYSKYLFKNSLSIHFLKGEGLPETLPLGGVPNCPLGTRLRDAGGTFLL